MDGHTGTGVIAEGGRLFVAVATSRQRCFSLSMLRLVLSRYFSADSGADFRADLRTKPDQMGPKSTISDALDRMIPASVPILKDDDTSRISATH